MEVLSQLDEVQDLLCKNYLINAPDVRSCPNSKCGFMGIVLIDDMTDQI